jgi:hypothetical protein
MAYIAKPTYDVTFSFRDNNDNSSTATVRFNASILYTDVLVAANTMAARLAAVSDAHLTGFTIGLTYMDDTFPVFPAATSEVERKLRIPLATTDNRNATYLEVPSPIFSAEQDGTDITDPSNAAVAALRTALVNGGGILGTAQPATWFGADIIATGDPFVLHRNRRRKG